MAHVLLYLLALGAALAPHAAANKPVSSDIIAKAIDQAYQEALICKGKPGCLGKAVVLTLTTDVIIKKALPELSSNAHLIIKGACARKTGDRCVIDGQGKYPAFIFSAFGSPPPKLELINLIFQKTKGGVLGGTLWVNSISTNVIFKNNVGPVVVSSGPDFGGVPKQEFYGCRFVQNTGGALNLGNPKYGLGYNGLGLYVKDTRFIGNKGSTGDGGAVILAGSGTAIFENVLFENNTAPGSGGAVYADEVTDLRFRSVIFRTNKAKTGGGGAVAGTSAYFQQLKVGFCSSQFQGNKAPKQSKANQLYFQAQQSSNGGIQNATINFCNTPVPSGSVFPPPPPGQVNKATGSCDKKYC